MLDTPFLVLGNACRQIFRAELSLTHENRDVIDMPSLLQYLKHVLRRKTSYPRSFSSKSFPIIPSDESLEEETLPLYDLQHFYPVHIGDIYQSKYQVLGKLGYGAFSTNWLCRDLCDHKYVTLKVSTCVSGFADEARREYKAYEHLANLKSTHPGQARIRHLYDTFELIGPSGQHQCLVLQLMHMTILDLMSQGEKTRPLDLALLKMILRALLDALDFLHTGAGVVHTDLKTDSIMLTVEDESIFKQFETAEIESPTPRKPINGSRTIYRSRRLPKPRDGKYGFPRLCDLGALWIGTSQKTGPFVQPHQYRAPEVIFEMPWGPPIDIWNVAALIWDLFEGQHLFDCTFDDESHHDPFKHIALMVGLLGNPPANFVKRSETTDQCFDETGNWIANEYATVPSISLEEVESRLQGREQELLLAFIQSMLKWLPEERKTAKELLQDPFLKMYD